MKRLLFLTLALALCGAISALTLNLNVDTAAWTGSTRGEAATPMLEPGVPALNYLPVRVLLPFGEKVANVSVTLSEPVVQRDDVLLDYVRAQQIISQPHPDSTQPDPVIWNADSPWPSQDLRYLGTQVKRGFQIAVIDVYPWKYNPVAKSILASETVQIEIETVWDESEAVKSANFFSPSLNTDDIAALVLNPEALSSYQAAPQYRNHVPQSRLIDLSVPKKMIIITNTASSDYFQNYIQWRANQNISTGLFMTSDIYSSYPGTDNAEKVRNFIIDAYQTWATTATPLEYVILGGDDEIVPERGCYGQVGDTVDQRMPTDLYFSNLDGNWNSDGDQIWGEQLDNVDMLPEVHIGRFPAETAAEFANIIRKTQYYVDYDTFSNNMSIMFGENLNNNPLTWGGDYKDDVATHIPESYFIRTLYQRDGTYSDSGVWNAINEGAHVMNHMGHANETFLLGQGNSTIEQLENTEYGFLYTQGCYPAAFDQRTSGDGESIAEHMSTTDGGVFAFIGNTRYGWYAPGSINGASQFYDREYFIGLFETLNTRFGQALTYSREQNLNAALNNDVMRWCYYEVVLFGDPSIEVKYPDPILPLLTLEDYSISDVEGDNDGSINPGEILRIYPVIRNHADWGTAYNVSVALENAPDGVVILDGTQVIPQIAPGATNDPSFYIRIQLPQSIPYGNYYLKLALDSIHPTSGLSTGIRKFDIGFEITMIDNSFPWDCPVQTKSAPIVYDFNRDGELDIMYLDVYGEAHFINNQGIPFGGYESPLQQDIMRSPAMGDITGDANPEIIYASRTGQVYAANLGGNNVFTYNAGSPLLFSPVIATLDNSGADKVLVGSLDGNLHAIDGFGDALTGFPVDLGAAFYSELAAADLDGDGIMEIIAGTQNGQLHVLSGNGTEKPGFPVATSGVISGAPTVLDNGNIVLGTNTRMLIISPSGETEVSREISAAMASSPSLADIDADGELEIIFVTISGTLYAKDQDGNDLDGFPVNAGAIFNTPPLILNLDADPLPEILLTSYINSVYAYNNDGTMLPGFPFITSYNGSTPATVCDLEGDDMLKLVSGYSTGIVVMNLRRPETSVMPWTTYRGSLTRQGSFAATGYVPNSDPVVPAYVNSLAQNYPNPFNPSTTISFQTEKDGTASLSVYNLKGQLVRVLSGGFASKGNHSVVWDGRDDNGHAVSSGVYLYRLQTQGGMITRRMLLIK
jgi:hypothetical protein